MKILAITPDGKMDYLATSILEGLKKFDIELYCTNEGNGAVNIISDNEFHKHVKDADFVFAIWGKVRDNNPPKFYLIKDTNCWDKVVYIDGSEYSYTGYKEVHNLQLHPTFQKMAKYYFKRECLPEHIEQGIIPLPFAAVDSDFFKLPKAEKHIDVLCAFGQRETGQRKIAIEACRDLKEEGYLTITKKVVNYERHMNESWITIDAHGGGECNARAFQIMANGSTMFAEKYNIVMPNLEDGKHYVGWTDKEDLKDKLRTYLANKPLLEQIAEDSYNNLIEHHTSEKRVKYILENIIK